MRKTIHFASNFKEIELLANFIHREILQLLSERPSTQTELSKKLGLTKSAVGYHLKQLMQTHLIYIAKVEAESHNILQKFYSPIAQFIIASYDQTPDEIKRYFIQMQIEHLIGILAALQCEQSNFLNVHPIAIEKLATILWRQVEQTSKKYADKKIVENAESLKIMIYADALKSVMSLDEWKALLPLS